MIAAGETCAVIQRLMSILTILAEATTAAVTTGTANSLDMTGMMDILLIVSFIGCGIYSIYSYFIQRQKSVLLENKIICPNNCEPKKCKDAKEFLQFILPRTLILGIGLVVFGGLFVLDHFFGNNNSIVTLLLVILPTTLFIWYVVVQQKAAKRFW